MPLTILRALTLATLALAGSCGPRSGVSSPEVAANFDCRNRRAAYELTNGFGAHKIGVALRCDDGPTLTSFRQETADDERKIQNRGLSSAEFDSLWEKIDSTGWRHLEDCDESGLAEQPHYVITVGDHAASVTIKCTGKTLAFPYDQLVNELELKAAGLGGRS